MKKFACGIDIGGQDSKIIHVDAEGRVLEMIS
jgi:activator of 2-hydroxyglutaryl-CoA dehydratase